MTSGDGERREDGTTGRLSGFHEERAVTLAGVRPVAAAVATGGIALTGDPDDLASLAAPFPAITVQSLH